MRPILVTGGAGFIGSHIVRELLKRGERVRLLDNFSTGKWQNIENFRTNANCEIVEGDIRSYRTVAQAVDGIELILHQAALPSVPRSIDDPVCTNAVNIGGTLNVLEAARKAKVKRVVFASSSSVYGGSLSLPKREDMPPHPLSPYAVSKLAGENYCKIFAEIYGLETVVLRYFNVFGPDQDPGSQYSAVIPKFISLFMRGKSPTIYGDGLQSRDFTYVRNVVLANLLACDARNANRHTFNIACGKGISLRQLTSSIGAILNTKIEPRFEEARSGEVKHSLADVSKAAEILAYEPLVSLEEGLRLTVASMSPRAFARAKEFCS